MTPPFFDDPALLAVMSALPRARVVGGAVRDWIAGRPTADIDLATPDTPDATVAALARAGLRAVPTGIDHGTVTAVAGGGGFEVTTLRRDEATDGRHATVAFTDDWREDAARRDFTINAMSMARDGTVFDYFGGRDDLAAGRVRFVGAAAARVAEDYLRILRFFRFLARYGRDVPDDEAIAAIRAGVPGLAILSVERVWREFSLILRARDPGRSISLMKDVGVLGAILPEASAFAARMILGDDLPPDPILRLASLLDGADTDAVAVRWRLSGTDRDRLNGFHTAPSLKGNESDDELLVALANTPPDTLSGRAAIEGKQHLVHRIALLRRPIFPIEGRDVVALGVPPGPRVGELLRATRAWWLAHGCRPDAAACRAELARLIAA